MEPKKPRTIIYIDGFNLYYGALKGTKFKWLDLQTLFQKLLGDHHTITEIKYFTARVSARDSDPDAPNRQDAYLNSAISKMVAKKKKFYKIQRYLL